MQNEPYHTVPIWQNVRTERENFNMILPLPQSATLPSCSHFCPKFRRLPKASSALYSASWTVFTRRKTTFITSNNNPLYQYTTARTILYAVKSSFSKLSKTDNVQFLLRQTTQMFYHFQKKNVLLIPLYFELNWDSLPLFLTIYVNKLQELLSKRQTKRCSNDSWKSCLC